MNAKDRSKIRAQRREQERLNKKIARSNALETVDVLFSQHNLTGNSDKSCRGVMWKATAQNAWMTPLESGYNAECRVHDNMVELHQLYTFTTKERGKDRHIAAPGILDRPYYKVSAQYLMDSYDYNFISTNSACIKSRGYLYSLEHWMMHARRHFRENGRDGYYIRIDIHDFFQSLQHDTLKKNHDECMMNPDMRAMIEFIEDYYDCDVGCNLGMETSQAEAAKYLDGLDHYVTCNLHIKNYGHYMDDIYLFTPIGIDPHEVLRKINRKLQGLGLKLNTKKTKIYTMNQSLPFCKATFRISETGVVTVRGCQASARKTRQKIRSFAKKYKSGEMLGEDARLAISSAISYFDNYDNHKTQRELYALVEQEFGIPLDDVKAWRVHDIDILVAKERITPEYANLLKQRGKTTAIYFNPIGSHPHKKRRHKKHNNDLRLDETATGQLQLHLN